MNEQAVVVEKSIKDKIQKALNRSYKYKYKYRFKYKYIYEYKCI